MYGGADNDNLNGGAGGDNLYGGTGADAIIGGTGMDWFFFEMADSGDIDAGQADTILDFNGLEDTIYLKGSYTYVDNTSAPGDGQYSVWNNSNAVGRHLERRRRRRLARHPGAGRQPFRRHRLL